MTLECCCSPGKLKMWRMFIASFVYEINKIPDIISNLGEWWAAKTCWCLLCFSALKGQLACIFFWLKGQERTVDYSDSHFRSCYIEYNHGQTKWKIRNPLPHFDDGKMTFWLWFEFIFESSGWVVLFLKLFCPRLKFPDENDQSG